MSYWQYLAFPTITRTKEKGTQKGGPFNIYKVSPIQYISPNVISDIKTISAYKVKCIDNEGEFVLENLENSYNWREHVRISKWVIDRNILDVPEAGCHVSEQEVMDMLSGKK